EKMDGTPGVQLVRSSCLLENPAVGGPADSPAFLNAAAELFTTLSPRALLNRLLEIERELGRSRTEKWGPRILDLDLLLYGDDIVDEPSLTIPHPLLHQRRFVLGPLAEIAPRLMHPLLQRTIKQLLASLPAGKPDDSAKK
ncbi:MAG TPA: 2-amino-4-hydroxy-6-hydroxymethyldihydropteridine diphosphokinase, partial [Tepidisphaeraceae bacterium]